MKRHTLKDSIIERLNFYQGRLVENMANIIYFEKLKKTQLSDEDTIKASQAIMNSKANIKSDKVLIASFEEVLESIKTPKVKAKKK